MCPVMIITIYFEADHKKLVSSQKSSIFGPQKGHFVQSGPRNGPPNGQTATYQKTKGIQSSLRIWRSCHPIESGPSEPKKWGFHRCSVKKRRISGKKCSFLARNPFFLEIVQLYLSPPWPDTKKTTFFCWLLCTGVQKKGFGPKTAFLDPKRATLGNRGHETARQAAKRPPTGKLKVSRVTSGYGGLMIPLSRGRLSWKNGGFIGVA